MPWPTTPDALAREQDRLATAAPEPWDAPDLPFRVAACAVVFGRAGADGFGWAAAALEQRQQLLVTAVHAAPVVAPFESGQLALREGPILEAVVRRLQLQPDVLIVAAAGRDHPRRAGLALHLGAVLGIPTVGVTEDALVARGEEPEDTWAASAPLRLDGRVVAYRLRTRQGSKPVVAHAAWRTSAELASDIVLGSCQLARWPEPMREARRLARELRSRRGAHRPT